MSKYYKVPLYVPEQEEIYFPNKIPYIICKRCPFSKTIFQEIITDKKIYPKTYGKTLQSQGRFCYEISQSEVEQWLNNLDQVKLRNHINMINTIEEIMVKDYEARLEYSKQLKSKETLASRRIKKTLRKIKQR